MGLDRSRGAEGMIEEVTAARDADHLVEEVKRLQAEVDDLRQRVSQLDSLAIHRLVVYVYSLSHPGAIARDSAAARAALPAAAADSSSTH